MNSYDFQIMVIDAIIMITVGIALVIVGRMIGKGGK